MSGLFQHKGSQEGRLIHRDLCPSTLLHANQHKSFSLPCCFKVVKKLLYCPWNSFSQWKVDCLFYCWLPITVRHKTQLSVCSQSREGHRGCPILLWLHTIVYKKYSFDKLKVVAHNCLILESHQFFSTLLYVLIVNRFELRCMKSAFYWWYYCGWFVGRSVDRSIDFTWVCL